MNNRHAKHPRGRGSGLGMPLFRAAVLMCAAGLLIPAGCGQSSNRAPVEAAVTLDGEPLDEGAVTLLPLPGTSSPSAGANISQGRFSIPVKGGPLPGEFRVEIVAMRPISNSIDYEQYLPARYNKQSELTIEIKDDGPNEFTFDLTSE